MIGASDNFGGVDIAFSPMLQTDDGAVLLNEYTVYKYIWGLIDKLSKGGKEWTNEDLLKLDTEGLEIDGQKIKGLIADIGETAIQTGESMHFAGKDGAVAQAYQDLQQYADKYGISVDELIKKCNGLSDEINLNETAMKLLEGAFNGIVTPFEKLNDVYGETLSNFENINSLIQTVSSSMTTLADIQETVAEGFTISLDKALEFASVYPQILDGATVSADGQITLNEDIVNSFIEGKQAELKTQIDAEIEKLNSDKSVLTAKKEYAEAQLELAKNVGQGEGEITEAVAEHKINTGNDAIKKLIEAGVDEANAYKLACMAMSGNVKEFDRIAMQACIDIDGNFNEAAYSAAQNIYNNMNNAKRDVNSLTLQAHEAAKAIAGIASGLLWGFGGLIEGSGGGTSSGSYSMNLTTGEYNGVDYSYTPKDITLDKFIADVELDISGFEKAIQQLDGQIAALQVFKDIDLEEFSTSYKEKQKEGEKASKSDQETWFDLEYKEHKHKVAMDQETESDYLDWLNGAYKKAYEEGIIDLDEYYKYEEEVYNGRKKLAEGATENAIEEAENWFEREYSIHKHKVAMDQETESDYLDWLNEAYRQAYEEGIIDLDDYYKYEEEVYNGRKKIAEETTGEVENWFEKEYKAHQHYREMEEETEADYLKWLNSAYQEAFEQGLIKLDDYRKYREEVYNGLKSLKSNAESSIKELVNIRLSMLKDEVEREKEALNQKLSNLKDFYQKQKDMLQESYDNEKYLEEQAEKRKSVADIQAEIDQLRFDDSAWAQKRRIELEKELKDAAKTLDDFEKEHTLKDAQDQYDKLYEQQEKTLTEQTAKQLYERALNDIKNGSISLYNEMIEWNEKYGDGIAETITKAWEEAYKAEKEYFDYTGEHFIGVDLANATGYQKPTVSGYASGTNYATSGLHKVDEKGVETIFQSSDGQRYRMFSAGEKVLNAKASDFLFDFANRGKDILEKWFGYRIPSYQNINPRVSTTTIQQGDIIIHGNADKATVSEIRRAQREHLEQMLKQLNRLK